ncbi:MAG: glucose/mannose-6-phosphate isomerase [Parcubacteria group bacterium Athens1014_26]|nr:MAG: glucose/mannose-6-phosphate isomerase [Parcubacteria group bacterium Athens1014_26]
MVPENYQSIQINMEQFKNAITSFNTQLSAGVLEYFRLDKLKNTNPDAIVIVGMGGSGQIGNLIAGLATELKIPVPILIYKDYGLPRISYKNPFYLFISFSGNTAETISGFKKMTGLKAVVCSGGKLKKLADSSDAPAAIIPKSGLVSRQAAGYLFYGALQLIKTIFPNIKLTGHTGINPQTLEKKGLEIARGIKNKTILIYGSRKNNHLAYIWKTNLNETAKIPAFSNSFPEIAHNEITIFENNPKNTAVVLLCDEKDNPRIKNIMDIFLKLLKNKIPCIKINLEGKNELEKTWNNIILSGWTSYFLAQSQKINPRETKFIDKIKKLTK